MSNHHNARNDETGSQGYNDIQIPNTPDTSITANQESLNQLLSVVTTLANQVQKIEQRLPSSHDQIRQHTPSINRNPPVSEFTIAEIVGPQLSQDSNLSSGTSPSVSSHQTEANSICSLNGSNSTYKLMKSKESQKCLSREISVSNHFRDIEFKNLKFLTTNMITIFENVNECEICNTPIGRLEKKFPDTHVRNRKFNWLQWSRLGIKALQNKRSYINRQVKSSIMACK